VPAPSRPIAAPGRTSQVAAVPARPRLPNAPPAGRSTWTPQGAAKGAPRPAGNAPAPVSAPNRAPLPSLTHLLNRPPSAGVESPQLTSTVPPAASSDTVRVAILLPLSGPNRKIGEAMLRAAEQALFTFADERLELLPHDTGGSPDGALSAAQVAIGDGSRVILGPLLGTSVRAVRAVARAAGVPVVAFSSDRTVVGNGVYTLGFLPSAEVRRVVGYAVRQGLRRFAVLAPNDAYGDAVVSTAQAMADRIGGVVTRVQRYDPSAGDFSAPVRLLADYDTRRKTLMNQRKQLEGKTDDVSVRALERLKKLQTYGDLPYDALLLADGGKRLQSIAALLPFFDIDPAKIRMLGTGQWDESGIGTEPALIGGWFAAPPPSARGEFVQEYRQVFGAAPPRLATLAYDATALAAVLGRAEKGPDYSAAALTDANGFWGRDGVFRFRNDGTAERGLAVMQVNRKANKVLDPAPQTFQKLTN